MMTWNTMNIVKSNLSKTLATCFHSSAIPFSISSDFTFSLSTRISLSRADAALAVSSLLSTSSRTVTPVSASGSFRSSVGSTSPRRQQQRQVRISLMICSHLGTGRIGVTWCIFISIICIRTFTPQIVTVTVRYTAVMERKGVFRNMMTSSNGNIFRVTGPLCGEFTGPGEFPTQRPVTRSFDVYFDLRLNKRLCKQSWGWWFETLLCPLWRHSNETHKDTLYVWSSGVETKWPSFWRRPFHIDILELKLLYFD